MAKKKLGQVSFVSPRLANDAYMLQSRPGANGQLYVPSETATDAQEYGH